MMLQKNIPNSMSRLNKNFNNCTKMQYVHTKIHTFKIKDKIVMMILFLNMILNYLFNIFIVLK